MRFGDRKFFLPVLYSIHIVRKFIRYKTEMIENLQIFRMTCRKARKVYTVKKEKKNFLVY
jgi:hypothetical protein